MKVRRAIGQLVTLLACGPTAAQGFFSFTIAGPQSVGVPAGGVVRETYDVLLGHSRSGPGAEAWSFGVTASGAGIVGATTAGTIADSKENGGLWSNGFNKTYVTDPAKSIMGLELAATLVVLSLTEGTTLPLENADSVLVLEVSGPEGATSTLRGFEGSYGEIHLQNRVTVGGDSRPLCNSRTARIRVRHLPRDDFIRGNANGDAELDIADPVWILNDLFHDGPPSPCADAADSNDDGRIDISDAVHLIRYLFLTGDAPPAPFPECGLDGTEDDIVCPGGLSPCRV